MGKIFYVMGKSASGKDTIYQRLIEDARVHTRSVVPYTTRPIREGEIEGENYFFCTEQEVSRLEEQKKIIELRVYKTVHGDWKYFTVEDGQIDLASADFLMIGTLESYRSLCNYFGADKVMPVYVEVEDGERLQRALTRERSQSTPRYEEMCRRFLEDQRDFSEEKIQEAGITRRFLNTRLETVLEEIVHYINQNQ